MAGDISNRRHCIYTPEELGIPDGCTMDRAGACALLGHHACCEELIKMPRQAISGLRIGTDGVVHNTRQVFASFFWCNR